MSPCAISRALNRLEQAVGPRLSMRDNRTVQLIAPGRFIRATRTALPDRAGLPLWALGAFGLWAIINSFAVRQHHVHYQLGKLDGPV
ncbi:MAG: hypothetical protein GKR94_10595 [Gammaproteobacteria bacterium]|nr:hypothetical protein [Gammaproteobacteria bacterium]